MRLSLLSPCLAGLFACASVSTPAPETAPPPSVFTVEADQLHGHWAEYWAPGGTLKTQRHLFMPDGRWAWVCEGGCPEPVRRSGRWSLDGSELRIDADGTEQRMALGPCPPNDEARAMDAEYRCLTIGRGIFWWQAAADTPGSEQLLAPAAP